jgi:hypothetical protein
VKQETGHGKEPAMTTATLGQLIDKHGFDVLDHLDRDLEIPVHAGLQAQGDLFIIPVEPDSGGRQGTAVPPAGIAVIEAVHGGHEHRLFAGQPGTASFTHTGRGGQDIGILECTEPAYLAHPEHAYTGIAPGTYTLRRQREQADDERLVAD